MLKKLFGHRFSKFVVVGVFNTMFGYLVYVLSLYAGLHYSLAAFISIALGALFNFQTTGHFVFGSRHRSRLLKFLAVYGIVYIAKVSGLFFLKQVGIDPYLGGAILIIPLALLSYTLNKNWVFKSPDPIVI